jgi:5-(carboxyamino)imidazole ribonucleotide mutase
MAETTNPLVLVVMGSTSDWSTMRHTNEMLDRFGIAHECRALSAHRTPDAVQEYISSAEGRGVEVVIAAAGGAAHLAGVCAAHTILPVLGVPIESASLKGLDSLLSTVQMPGGIPVPTLAIGKPRSRSWRPRGRSCVRSLENSEKSNATRCCRRSCRRSSNSVWPLQECEFPVSARRSFIKFHCDVFSTEQEPVCLSGPGWPKC